MSGGGCNRVAKSQLEGIGTRESLGSGYRFCSPTLGLAGALSLALPHNSLHLLLLGSAVRLVPGTRSHVVSTLVLASGGMAPRTATRSAAARGGAAAEGEVSDASAAPVASRSHKGKAPTKKRSTAAPNAAATDDDEADAPSPTEAAAVVLKSHIVARLAETAGPRGLLPRAPPPFSGDAAGGGAAPLDEWLRTVLAWLDAGGAGAEAPRRQCALVAQLFTGAAQAWWHQHIDADTAPASLPALDTALHARFMPLRATTATRAMLHGMRQGDQPLQAFTSAFQAAAAQLPSMAHDEAVHYFVSGLAPALRNEVFRAQPATLAEAVQVAVRCDALAQSAASMGAAAASRTASRNATTVAALNNEDSSDGENDGFAAAATRRRSKSGVRRNDNAELAEIAAIAARAAVDAASGGGGDRRRGGGGGSSNRGNCYNCGKSGHMAKACSAPPRCHRCQATGHIASKCTAPAPVDRRVN